MTPSSTRRPEPLFWLLPTNNEALGIVMDPANSRFVNSFHPSSNIPLLDVGRATLVSGGSRLASIGRKGDIVVNGLGHGIAGIQCSFEIHPKSQAVMFYDRSHSQTSQVFGDRRYPFEHGRSRKVLVKQDVNTCIGFGGDECCKVTFEILWADNEERTMRRIKERPKVYDANPELADTIDEGPTALSSRMRTRIHTIRLAKLRWMELSEVLGRGAFGNVKKGIDIDGGDFVAIKILYRSSIHQNWEKVKQEIEILSGINHANIIKYLDSKGWETLSVKIVTEICDGSVLSLIDRGLCDSYNVVTETLFYHSLQALDYLDNKRILHRDIKPDNILYTLENGQYTFKIADFGVSHHANNARTMVGSPRFMAPEVRADSRIQTSKLDVWSLYVTMLWTLNAEGFREEAERETFPIQLAASKRYTLNGIFREMGRINPEHRASAAQMLVKVFQGQGLSSRGVPPLRNTPEPQFWEHVMEASPNAIMTRARTRALVRQPQFYAREMDIDVPPLQHQTNQQTRSDDDPDRMIE